MTERLVSGLRGLFWAESTTTQGAILIVVGAGLLAFVVVYLPLLVRLLRCFRLQARLVKATRNVSAEGHARDAIDSVLCRSLLKHQWEEFKRRFRDSENVESHRSPVRFASLFDESPLLPTGWRRSLLPSLPSIFLALGIFGTFVGLTLAIPEARSNTAIDRHSVDVLTASLGLAFRTSLWGMLLSVLSVVAIRWLEGGFEAREERIDALVHREYEWISEGELAAQAVRAQRDASSSIRGALTDVAIQLKNILAEGLREIQESASSAAQNVSQELLERLSRAVEEGVGAQVEALRAAIEKTAELQEDVGTSLALVFEQMQGAAQTHERITRQLGETAGAVEQASARLGDAARALDPALAHLREAGSSLQDTSRSMAETQAQTASAISSVRDALAQASNSLDQQRAIVETTLSELRTSMEQFSQGVGDNLVGALRNMESLLGDSLTRVSGTALEMREVLERMGPAVREVRETSDHVRSSLAELGTAVSERAPELRDQMGALSDAIHALRTTQEESSRQLAGAGGQMESLSARVEGLATRVSETLDPVVRSVGQATQELVAVAKALESGNDRDAVATRTSAADSSPTLEPAAPPQAPSPSPPPSQRPPVGSVGAAIDTGLQAPDRPWEAPPDQEKPQRWWRFGRSRRG